MAGTQDHGESGSSVPTSVPWGVLQAAAIIGAWLVLQVVGGVLVAAWRDGLGAQLAVAAFSDMAVLALVCTLVTIWGASSTAARNLLGFGRLSWQAFRRAWRVLAAGAAAYAVVWAASLAVAHYWMGLDRIPVQPMVDKIREAESAGVVGAAFVVAVVIAPVAEEVVFRSVLYLPLRARLGVIPAATIVSAFFALVHRYPWGAANLLVLSLAFVALFERTGTLWAPIAAHGLYNGVELVLVRLMGASG